MSPPNQRLPHPQPPLLEGWDLEHSPFILPIISAAGMARCFREDWSIISATSMWLHAFGRCQVWTSFLGVGRQFLGHDLLFFFASINSPFYSFVVVSLSDISHGYADRCVRGKLLGISGDSFSSPPCVSSLYGVLAGL